MKTRLSSLNQLRSIFLSFFVAVALASCGGGGGSSNTASDTAGSNSDQEGSITEGEQVDGTDMESTESIGNTETDVLIGVFIDSPVEGVSYMTETQSGTTNSAGEFSYIAGENVTFSIGTLEFPTVPAATQITPVDLAQGSPSPTETITNIAVLLQSLDEDGNASNGITIPESAAASAAPVDLFADVDQFSNDAVVINLVANSGSTTTTLISAGAANEHLLDSIGFDNTADEGTQDIIEATPVGKYQAVILRNSVEEAIEITVVDCDGNPITNDPVDNEFTIIGDACITLDGDSIAAFLPDSSVINSGDFQIQTQVFMDSDQGGSVSGCTAVTDGFYDCTSLELNVTEVQSIYQISFGYVVYPFGGGLAIAAGLMNVHFNRAIDIFTF